MLRAPGVLFTGLRVLQLPASMYHLSRHRVVVFTTCEPMEAAYILPGVNSRLGLCMRLPGCSLDMFHVVWYHRIAILTVHFNGGGVSLMSRLWNPILLLNKHKQHISLSSFRRVSKWVTLG